LATLSEALIRVTERPPVTRLIATGTELTIDRSDFPRASPRPGLRLMDLTFNIILLTTLFAADRRPLSDRNVGGLLLACLVLVLVHVAAVVVNVQSIYALRLGAWSQRNYGVVARNFWGAAAHFYSLVGVFGASFALWWLFRPSPAQSAGQGAMRA
jgi:type IV secretory pathway VirB3-like protein